MNRPRAVPPILVVGVMAALPACGSSGPSPVAAATCVGTVALATDLPTGGSDASDGVPTENGARLAVEQAAAAKVLEGCTINLITRNDSSVALGGHDPKVGAANLTELAANPSVLGVVGPSNSNVGEAEAPIANRAGLTMISPENTDPGLTIPGSNPDVDTASLRPKPALTYFRVCTTDIGQGRALAQVAAENLRVKRVFVVDDQETYGKGLAAQFLKYFIQAGGASVGQASEPSDARSFAADLNRAEQGHADLVFFGGTSGNGGGLLRRQQAARLPGVRFLGGDGIVDGEFFTTAGPVANGVDATVAAPDPQHLDSARQFVADFKARFHSDPGPYSANSYDAMNILIQAVKGAIDDNHGTLPGEPRALREAVRQNVAATSYDGAIGHTSFDRHGDTTNVLLTLVEARNGNWEFKQTLLLRGT